MDRTRILALLCMLALLPRPVPAADDAKADRTLSPYFFVHSDDPQVDKLPLKDTQVEIAVAGVIADVKVTQRYRNDGTRPIEAEYVFPGSTRAAVYGLTMTIGERRVVAQIREKQQARAEYQAAKSAGKSAALLEQHRPNVFKMSVANILPGDDIAVELRYTELIVPTDSIYELVFPTVVGPRYTTDRAAGAAPLDRWQRNPYLHEGEPPPGGFHLEATIDSGIALKEVGSPSHDVQVRYDSAQQAHVDLPREGGNAANRDFILRYRLAGASIESGILLFEGARENYFLAMIEPPQRVTAAQIPARDYVFIVDVSGSMHGFPLDVTKELMRNLLTGLRPTDTFNVMLFSGSSLVLADAPLPATEENVRRGVAFIDSQSGSGSTELLPALRRALALPGGDDRARSIVVATDGYVTVETEAFDVIRESLGQANLFAFGIGSGVNRYLIEGMARVGQGEPFVVTNEGEAAERAEALRRYIEAPVLTKARLSATGFEIYDMEPPGIPDVLAQRPVIVFGKWRGRRTGQLTLRGLAGDGPFERSFDLSKVRPAPNNAALSYLWARGRIARLDDYQRLANDPDRVKEITQLGLDYHLLTAYTSFIAVDEVVRNTRPEDAQTVRQPLPLPQGVSNLAVGGEVPTTPEPELLVLVGVSAAVAAWARRRKAKSRAK
ncbi:MAG TPA: VIT and VWA domain-containing protein [Steroidobacteraceae bacterium]|nr:VIT and VWA domain-containing protein [Steroidobacteraceae bacterium]